MTWLRRFSHLFGQKAAIPRHPSDDFVAIGYPKTGNTWTRVMLGRYIQLAYGLPELVLFDDGEREPLRAAGYSGPFGIFTHSPLDSERQIAEDLHYDNVVAPFSSLRVVLLVRDPLDTLVSAFMQAVHRNTIPYKGGLADFLEDPVHGFRKLVRFYQIWAENSASCNVLTWRYEDIRKAPQMNLGKLIDFIGAKADPSLVDQAIEYSSFQSMQEMEKAGNEPTYRSSGLPIFATGDRNNPDAYHVRRGEVGGYRTLLGEELASHFEQRVAQEMPSFYGY
jgi:hypothetical protein